jgi:hypothetical protein
VLARHGVSHLQTSVKGMLTDLRARRAVKKGLNRTSPPGVGCGDPA